MIHEDSNSSWLFPKTIAEAKAVQQIMADTVLLEDRFKQPLLTIAGLDVSNTPFDPGKKIFGSAVVLDYPSLEIRETATRVEIQEFPYIPGLLGFREAPVLVHTYQQLAVKPDLIMVDGHGISHPRGLGIASHLGVLLDIPTIGVAKSILVGELAEPLTEEAGSMVPLVWKGKQIAMVVRTKKRCSPLIISAGHKVSLETALTFVMSCLKKYRLPEPTRHAHLAANQCRTGHC